MNSLGGCPKGLAGKVDQAEDGESGIRQRRERLGQARPLGVVTILVPPAVLDEMKAVFHLPVAANVRLELGRPDQIRIQTGHEVPAFARKKLAVGRAHFAIYTDSDLATGYVQMLPDILGVVEVDPKPASFLTEPLFSVTSWAGRAGVS